MSYGRLPIFDTKGRAKLETYFIYAAFAPICESNTYVKVGISMTPARRVWKIHCDSPNPIQAALWAVVGSKALALSVERSIHARLAEFKTRGEWFQLDMTSAEHKRKFHDVCKTCFARATGRMLKWHKSNFQQILNSLGIDPYAIAVKQKGG